MKINWIYRLVKNIVKQHGDDYGTILGKEKILCWGHEVVIDGNNTPDYVRIKIDRVHYFSFDFITSMLRLDVRDEKISEALKEAFKEHFGDFLEIEDLTDQLTATINIPPKR